jgi:hypothetical protein
MRSIEASVRGFTPMLGKECVYMVGVYRPQQPSKTAPNHYVTLEAALQMVKNGLASWINRSRAVRLTSLRKQVRGESCRMGPGTIEAYAAGSPVAAARLQAWQGLEVGHLPESNYPAKRK